MFPPVVIFAYKRVHHLAQCVNSLLANAEAPQVDVIIYCDGPRGSADLEAVKEVRCYASLISGFKSVQCVFRDFNMGLASSVVAGVSEVLHRWESVIVLEDDLVVSPFFLKYMSDALHIYRDDITVASVHGWCFPHAVQNPPETFFLRGAECWGWATWRRAWKHYTHDALSLAHELERKFLSYDFDLNGSYPYLEMLYNAGAGTVDSWAIRWRAATYLRGMLSLHPGRSLVNNIGLDASGTHLDCTGCYVVSLEAAPVTVRRHAIVESPIMREASTLFHGQVQSHHLSCRRLPLAILKAGSRFLRKFRTAKFLQILGRLRKGNWSGNFTSWHQASSFSRGYDQVEIVERNLNAARAVFNGEALWDRDSMLFFERSYNYQLLVALLNKAACNKGCLTVVDFGGSFGSVYGQHKDILQKLPSLSWQIVEQYDIVELGKSEFTTNIVSFHHNFGSLKLPPDVVLLSGVLQYIEDPYSLLSSIAELNPAIVFVDRTPFMYPSPWRVRPVQDRLAVQFPKAIYGENSSYPMWIFSQNNFIKCLFDLGYCVESEFESLDGAFSDCSFRGFCFVKQSEK